MKDSDTNKSGLFRITVFNAEYTCSLKDRVYSQRQVTNNLVGRIVKPKLIDHKRKYTPSNIKKKRYEVGSWCWYILHVGLES